LTSAVKACHRFAQEGFAGAIGFWSDEGDDRRLVADAYLNALAVLAGEGLDCYLSIKAPALGLSQNLVNEVAEAGREAGIGIHFDSLSPEEADQTFDLIAESVRRCPQLGCTLPGRWQRSPHDADLAVRLGLRVRVVKGQWVDPHHPDLDLREGFLAVIDRLAGRARYVAVATHDPPLVSESLRRLQAAGTPCGLELLYGLPLKAAARAARDADVTVRLYVPYGKAWLPYQISQVRKNPRVLWWVMRDAIFNR
jgi:proline dehydrogenase